MKIKESYLEQALKADRNDKSHRTGEAHQPATINGSEVSSKSRQTGSAAKEGLKFSQLLESTAKLQKSEQQEDSGEERHDDQRKDKKNAAEKKEADEHPANEPRVEKYDAGSRQTGGQSHFGPGGNISGSNLSENFAARSILHIADLERMVLAIRKQSNLRGKREIVLQLKRSVLEGLQVKISTEADSKVQLEFLTASEKVYSQIEKHRDELAEILRGRGINLGTLKTSLNAGETNDQTSLEINTESVLENKDSASPNIVSAEDDTFASPAVKSDPFYKA